MYTRIKIGLPERIFDIINIFIMILLMILTIYPILHVLFGSLSTPTKLMEHTGILLRPLGFTLNTYSSVFLNPGIRTGYFNTLFIVLMGIIIGIILTSMGAYVLSRKNLLWRKPIMLLIIFTMFFNGGLIPFYLIVKGVGLRNTLWSVIVPFAVNTFNLIIMRTYFETIPDSMEESAKIDGASHFTILFRIIIPLSIPIIAVMILYYGVDKWNGWFYASIFIQDRVRLPLQVILREILLQDNTESMTIGSLSTDKIMAGESVKYAAIMIATVPVFCIYPFLQKYFMKGIMIGAVKG